MAGLYEITNVIEKPSPTLAEQHLTVPGLRAAQYLCFFGMHALSARFIGLLSNSESQGVSETLRELAEAERQEYAQHWERHQQEQMRDEEVAHEEALELKYYTQEHTCPSMRATEYCICGNVALGCLGGQECSSCFDDH